MRRASCADLDGVDEEKILEEGAEAAASQVSPARAKPRPACSLLPTSVCEPLAGMC